MPIDSVRLSDVIFVRRATLKFSLRSYISEPQLLALLVQTAAPAPENETQAEAKNLWTTINAFLEQEKEKLSAMETEKVEPDAVSEYPDCPRPEGRPHCAQGTTHQF